MDAETKRIRDRFNIEQISVASTINYSLKEYLKAAKQLGATDKNLGAAGDSHRLTVNTARALNTDLKRVQIGAPYNNKALPSTIHIASQESTQPAKNESLEKGNRQLIVIIATFASLCCGGSILVDSLLNNP